MMRCIDHTYMVRGENQLFELILKRMTERNL